MRQVHHIHLFDVYDLAAIYDVHIRVVGPRWLANLVLGAALALKGSRWDYEMTAHFVSIPGFHVRITNW